jgi:uncharacterized damage-inducible protein DinB
VADQKPPKLVAGERETLMALLDYQRQSILRKVDGLDDEQAGRRLVGSETSLLWLVKHLATAEATWVLQRFAGSTDPVPADAVTAEDTLAGATAAYRQTSAAVDAVAGAASLDDPCRALPGEEANLRWVLMHLLEETARHAGHADIIRELIDGHTGR